MVRFTIEVSDEYAGLRSNPEIIQELIKNAESAMQGAAIYMSAMLFQTINNEVKNGRRDFVVTLSEYTEEEKLHLLNDAIVNIGAIAMLKK